VAIKFEISRSLRGSFAITSATLENVYRHIAEAMGQPVSVTVRFINARTISTENLSSILSDSSISNHKIESIRLACGTFGDPTRSSVILGYSKKHPVLIEITGDRSFAISLEDNIVNELHGARSPVWLLNTHQWPGIEFNEGISMISLGILSTGIIAYVRGDWVFASGAYYYIFGFLMASALLGIFGHRLAPSIIFDFGIGATLNRRRRFTISIVLGTIGLGVLVNWLSSFVVPA